MEPLHPYVLILILFVVAVALYLLYNVARSLYQGFIDFSRRFRGVE